MHTLSDVSIREFQPGDEDAFRRLNEEWITRYFRLEPKDVAALGDPQASIFGHGGRIFFAVLDDRRVGCCALVPLGQGEWEVAKMAVTANCQGQGIGRRVLQAVVDAARAAGARRLWLETNHAMTPAIRLYERMGFRHIPAERCKPSLYARSDVQMEMALD